MRIKEEKAETSSFTSRKATRDQAAFFSSLSHDQLAFCLIAYLISSLALIIVIK